MLQVAAVAPEAPLPTSIRPAAPAIVAPLEAPPSDTDKAEWFCTTPS